MTRMAKLRQQTDGATITSSTSQVAEMYLLGTLLPLYQAFPSRSPLRQRFLQLSFLQHLFSLIKGYSELLELDRDKWPPPTVGSNGSQ